MPDKVQPQEIERIAERMVASSQNLEAGILYALASSMWSEDEQQIKSLSMMVAIHAQAQTEKWAAQDRIN